MTSQKEVFALFKNWKDVGVEVSLGCFFRGKVAPVPLKASVRGRVLVAEEPVIVVADDVNKSSVELDITGCTFKLPSPESNALPESPTPLDLATPIVALEIDFPTGEVCVVLVFRTVN